MTESRSSRRVRAGVLLTILPIIAVLAARGAQKPWIADAPAYRQKGSKDAKVVIVEFSDFQCPACAAAVGPLKHLENLYGDKIRVIFKHCPWVRMHRWAEAAALAAECAGQQGKFWELHDTLYENQPAWAESEKGGDMLIDYAHKAGLEPKAFAKCLADPQTKNILASEMQEAKDRWINSTPTFFINGTRFVGANQLRTDGVRMIEGVLGK